jgi:hypothetical protein
MRELEQLKKKWNDSAGLRGVQANICLGPDGLTLGARTVVAKRNRDGSLALDGEETKVFTLLSIAYGQALETSVLKTIRRVSDSARDGDECKAAMYLALAKLPRISDPADTARRLFIADGLIAAGVAPSDIWKALGFDPAVLASLAKYDQDQPRVPAGSGKPSGEWTSGGTANANTAAAIGALAPAAARAGQAVAQEAEAQAPRILARLPRVALRVAELAAHLNLFLDVAEEVLQPSDTGGNVISGKVRGMPNVYYQRHQDELALQLIDRSTGHAIATLSPTGVRGQYIDRETGIVAQMEGDELKVESVTRATSRTDAQTKKPELCQDPIVPDNAGMTGPRGERSKGYEAFMREETNPEDPTPPGMAYGVTNPVTDDIVKFDDCDHKTDDLMEYKGLGYAELLRFSKGKITKDWLDQATRQVQASGGRPVVWCFAEEEALEFARSLFQTNPLLRNIQLEYRPWPEGETWRWSRSKGIWLRALILFRLRKCLSELRETLRRTGGMSAARQPRKIERTWT